MVLEMVLQGVSTRKVHTDALCGLRFSKSTVSRLCKQLDARVAAFFVGRGGVSVCAGGRDGDQGTPGGRGAADAFTIGGGDGGGAGDLGLCGRCERVVQ